ncbi:MAG: hypothetical protein ACLU8W_00930 [Clostridia bacterium]
MKTPKSKRILGVVLSGAILVTSLSAALTAFAADGNSYDYDEFADAVMSAEVGTRYVENATPEQAAEAIDTLDNVLTSGDLMSLLGSDAGSLKEYAETLVAENLYTDATVTTLVKTIYPLLYDTIIDTLNGVSPSLGDVVKPLLPALNLYLSPSAAAGRISDDRYASAKSVLQAAGNDWANITEEQWASITWGVTDQQSFYDAIGQALNGLYWLLNCALNGGMIGYQDPVTDSTTLGIKCADGYADVVVPLLRTLGCAEEDIMSPEDYKAAQEESASTIGLLQPILDPILNRIYEICESPATDIVELLPSLLSFVQDGGLKDALSKLDVRFTYSIAWGATSGETSIINVYTLLNDTLTQQYGANLEDLNGLAKAIATSSLEGFQWVDLPIDTLASLTDKGEILLEVLQYAGNLVKANGQLLRDQIDLSTIDPKLAEVLNALIDQVLAAEPDQIATVLIHLLNPSCELVVSAYNYPDITKTPYAYPDTQYGKSDYVEFVQGLDGLLSGLGLEGLISGLLTNDTMNQILGLYDSIAADPTVAKVLEVIGVDVSAEAIAEVRADVQAINVVDLDSFAQALAVAFRPFNNVLALVFAGQDMTVLGGYTVPGYDGYNSVVIPLLEALGCTNVKSYADYQTAVEGGASPLEAILDQVIGRVQEILASPVDSLTKMLPNLAYFLSSDNLPVLVRNLVAPIDTLLSHVDVDIMADVVNPLLQAFQIPSLADIDNDLAGLLNTLLGETGIVLPQIDLSKLAAYGTLESYESVMVVGGNNVAAKRVVADQADVAGAVIEYIYNFLTLEGNMDAIGTLLGGLLGGEDMDISGLLDTMLTPNLKDLATFTNFLFGLIGVTPNPDDPEESTEPEDTTKPEGTTDPEDTTSPEETTQPEESTEPGGDTTQPEESTEPEESTQPDDTTIPEGTTQPEETSEPSSDETTGSDATEVPGSDDTTTPAGNGNQGGDAPSGDGQNGTSVGGVDTGDVAIGAVVGGAILAAAAVVILSRKKKD